MFLNIFKIFFYWMNQFDKVVEQMIMLQFSF